MIRWNGVLIINQHVLKKKLKMTDLDKLCGKFLSNSYQKLFFKYQ